MISDFSPFITALLSSNHTHDGKAERASTHAFNLVSGTLTVTEDFVFAMLVGVRGCTFTNYCFVACR
jgi:hypothetical protein